ncbi:Hypothetical predicted protein [Scomber scombrus]|uniref:Secreted protein n=1 Tax=Scomber scombrus TaxID=13677 RepID=A0AAV1NVR2_SCOSC
MCPLLNQYRLHALIQASGTPVIEHLCVCFFFFFFSSSSSAPHCGQLHLRHNQQALWEVIGVTSDSGVCRAVLRQFFQPPPPFKTEQARHFLPSSFSGLFSSSSSFIALF